MQKFNVTILAPGAGYECVTTGGRAVPPEDGAEGGGGAHGAGARLRERPSGLAPRTPRRPPLLRLPPAPGRVHVHQVHTVRGDPDIGAQDLGHLVYI